MLAPVLAVLMFMNTTACNSGDQPANQAAQAAPSGTQGQITAADFTLPPNAPPAPRVDPQRAMQYVREVVGFGPRPVGSKAHEKTVKYIVSKLNGVDVETDSFDARTPAGNFKMTNVIAKFPGKKDGIIVIAGHYDTKPLRNFVGANDGGSSTGLLLELANAFRGKQREGYSVFLVWLDGEEAIQESNSMTLDNSLYGSRHLEQKWRADGTLAKVKAFILTDMVGDADLNIDRELNSTDWLLDLVYRAASTLGYQSHFFRRQMSTFDDHTPFLNAGVPAVDLIDFDYGYNNVFWHTSDDTLDKLSSNSFRIVGDTVLETIRLLDSR